MNGLSLFCIEIIEYKDTPVLFNTNEIVSHFAQLQFYSNDFVISEASTSNRVMAVILNHMMLSD